MKKCFLSSIVLAFMLVISASFAFASPEVIAPETANQGSAIEIIIPNIPKEYKHVSFSWLDMNRKLFLKDEGEFQSASILIPMPYDVTKDQILKLHFGNETVTKVIKPSKVNWRKSTLTVEPQFIQHPAELDAKIKKDRAKSSKAFSTYTMKNELTGDYTRPAKGIVTSEYGVQRVYNGKLQSVHRGVDFRGATGVATYAFADGKVIVSDDFHYSGQVIYIDHGQGVISSYAHLSARNVKEGDIVKAGQTIGKIGATGRVTGPHLHFGLALQGIAIDAFPLLPKLASEK